MFTINEFKFFTLMCLMGLDRRVSRIGAVRSLAIEVNGRLGGDRLGGRPALSGDPRRL